MQFPTNPTRAIGRRPVRLHWIAAYRRLRVTLTEATRAYCQRRVQQALMIDPTAGDGLTVDVHFCEVR